jgi:hypothetical protein
VPAKLCSIAFGFSFIDAFEPCAALPSLTQFANLLHLLPNASSLFKRLAIQHFGTH